jgi:hypothetical protein
MGKITNYKLQIQEVGDLNGGAKKLRIHELKI